MEGKEIERKEKHGGKRDERTTGRNLKKEEGRKEREKE
jgi:hypothetical protein